MKNTMKILLIPVLLLLLSSSINVFSHKIKVISLKTDLRNCINEYSKLVKNQKMTCSKSLCEVKYDFPIKVEEKRNQCIEIESSYLKAFDRMPIKF